MKVLSEECSCENTPRLNNIKYQLLDTNCRVLHDIEGVELGEVWHYVVIPCGGRIFADSVRRELIKQSKIVEELKKIKMKVDKLGWDDADIPPNIFQKILEDEK